MFLLAFSLTLIGAAPTPGPDTGPARTRVLVYAFAGDGTDAQSLAGAADAVVGTLSERKSLEVLSVAEMRQLLALEADRASMDCDSSAASCQTEIANALGARYVVFGTVARRGDVLTIHLTLADAGAAVTLARADATADSARALPDAARRCARDLAGGLPGTPRGPLPWVAGVAGGIFAVGAVLALADGVVENGAVNNLDRSASARKRSEDNRNVAYGVAGGCALLAVAGLGGALWLE